MEKNDIAKLVKAWFRERYDDEKILVLDVTDTKMFDERLVYIVACCKEYPSTSIFKYVVWVDEIEKEVNWQSTSLLVEM